MFFGRKNELKKLRQLVKKDSASLVCLTGRRRIGKSTLIEEFAKDFKSFITVQGLAPDKTKNARDQLDHFSYALSRQLKLPKMKFEHWTEAFYFLAELPGKEHRLILLDEISWMATGDPLFASQLKDAWDMKFKKNPKLILVICGSVSTWIHDNILNHTNFVGRVSLNLNLEDLKLSELNQFWRSAPHVGSLEKMLILSVTGGVPKYLEEVSKTELSEKNILDLCFDSAGILYNDFDRIFTDIFGRKTHSLERLVRFALLGHPTPVELAKKCKADLNSDFYDNLRVLELAGFLSRDYLFKADGATAKLSRLRLKDNYLRFYLKYIEPNKERTKIVPFQSLEALNGFNGFLGLQFENLVLANRSSLLPHLGLSASGVVSMAPHWQTKNSSTKGACQIDLLIHSNLDVYFICEFKCKKTIDKTVIKELETKARLLKLPRRSSVRTVLVYEGEIYPPHKEAIESYFFRVIHFGELLVPKSEESL